MKQKQLMSSTGLIVAAVLAMATILLANGLFTHWRLDLTENKLFTLSEGTINIMGALEEPLTLDFYHSRQAMVDVPQLVNYANRVRDLLEEYARESGGKLTLTVIEPEPFSEEEDRAVGNGLQGVNTGGSDPIYLGLVGANSIDDRAVIPFFQPNREQELEYDITKLVYNLAHPTKRVVGILSGLPQIGNFFGGPENEWAVVQIMRDFFDVRALTPDDPDLEGIDVLMLIHPKQLDEQTLFTIDQFLLGGGKAMIFVDPLAEADNAQPSPQNPNVMPDLSSDLPLLFDAWGIDVTDNKIVADIQSAIRVQARTERGLEETNYLPWLQLDSSRLNATDFVTSELDSINLGTVGSIEKSESSPLELEALLESSADSMLMDSTILMFQRNPRELLSSFIADDRKYTLAARLSGKVGTAFPDGPPVSDSEDEDSQPTSIPGEFIKEGDLNVILVADTDILSDSFWINRQALFGIEIPQAIADNGNFIVNALENLSGSNDLISLRSRGEYSRPFTVVDAIRREAEREFREQEQILEARLAETEARLQELQQERGSNDLILTPEQSEEIEKFRQQQLNTRKELRAVQHELQKNIEQLGTILKFVNIGLMPLIIMLIAVSVGVFRQRRRSLTV